jgi:lysylphosphatidylglycerol synthetase-like protein (DUF2156 family)
MFNKSNYLTYLLLGIALFGYVLPWILTSTSPMSLGAYELAEWSSLHPSQPTSSPPMLVPLLLRLQLVIISVLVALHAQTVLQRWIGLCVIALLAVAQLPPLEFLTIARDNINYQQQFMLATISLIIGGGLIVRNPKQWQSIITVVLLSIGVISSINGLQQAQALYTLSLQEHTIGSGLIVTVGAYIIMLLSYGGGFIKSIRGNKTR